MIEELAEQHEPAVIRGVASDRSDVAVEVFVVAESGGAVGIRILLIVLTRHRERAVARARIQVGVALGGHPARAVRLAGQQRHRSVHDGRALDQRARVDVVVVNRLGVAVGVGVPQDVVAMRILPDDGPGRQGAIVVDGVMARGDVGLDEFDEVGRVFLRVPIDVVVQAVAQQDHAGSRFVSVGEAAR